MTPSPPANAFFVSKTWTSRDQKVASTSDLPGSIFVLFQPHTAMVVVEALTAGRVDFIFNRRSGGSDVPVSIDTSVEDTLPDGSKKYSKKTLQEYLECAQQLVSNLR